MLKLAYEAPRTGLHIAEAFAEADLPAGVLNVLTGRGSIVGAALVRDPRVRAISFTGSVATGHGVRDEATRLGKRVQLELGGHNPLIVMADADLDRAVEADVRGRVLVGGAEVHGDAAHLRAGRRLRRVPRASCSRASSRQGRRSARSRRRGRADRQRVAVRRGHRRDRTRQEPRAAASSPAAPAMGDEGWLVAPTVFEDVADDAFLSCEEVFGPVASLYRFATLDEALDAGERRRVRPLGGDLHLEPRGRDALPERGAGGAAPRQLADRRRRRARAVRRASSRAASARTSRAAPRSSSTPRRSPSTSTRERAVPCHGCARLYRGVELCGAGRGRHPRRRLRPWNG